MNWIHAFEFAGAAIVFMAYIAFVAVVIERLHRKYGWAVFLVFPLIFVPALFLIGLFS